MKEDSGGYKNVRDKSLWVRISYEHRYYSVMSYRDGQYNRAKVWNANILGSLLWRFDIFDVIDENACLKKYST